MFNLKKIFNKDTSETQLRKKISKEFSPVSKEYKIKNLELDKQFKGLSEEEFEFAVLDINHHPDSNDYKLYRLDLYKKYNKIDDFNYEVKKLELTGNKDTNDYKIQMLDIKLKYKQISENDREKEIATITNTPWFKFLNTDLEGDFFNLKWDCNEPFLLALEKQGYAQPSPEDNVMEWLKDGFMATFNEDWDTINKESLEFEANNVAKEQENINTPEGITIYS